MSAIILYITFVLLFTMGLFALIFKRNLIKIVIALNILDSGMNLFFITLGYRHNATAQIFTLLPWDTHIIMVLPTPKALILTNIVIGFATTALMLGVAILTYRNNKTLDTRKLRGVEEL